MDYIIDPEKIAEFAAFGRRWIDFVNRHGGTHHGYDPPEGASDRALALFSFPSLAAYEQWIGADRLLPTTPGSHRRASVR